MVLFSSYFSDARRCSSARLLLPPNSRGTRKYQRPRTRSADPFMNRRVELEDGFELLLHGSTVAEPVAQAEGLGERAHVGRQPEVTFRPVRLERDGRPRSLHAAFEMCAPLLVRRVAAEPVRHARELPGRLEIARVLLEGISPQR